MNRRRFLVTTTTLALASLGGCLQGDGGEDSGARTDSPETTTGTTSTGTAPGDDGSPVAEDPRDIEIRNSDDRAHTLALEVEFEGTVLHDAEHELDPTSGENSTAFVRGIADQPGEYGITAALDGGESKTVQWEVTDESTVAIVYIRDGGEIDVSLDPGF